uniref:Uncharacterized protein n=1 Tax=Tanacetum cinerariifolium TaxID=118510 RepID=A0A699H3Z1_TANCI|nr:hypothetical protein [Tanacetum cinerariifolium]
MSGSSSVAKKIVSALEKIYLTPKVKYPVSKEGVDGSGDIHNTDTAESAKITHNALVGFARICPKHHVVPYADSVLGRIKAKAHVDEQVAPKRGADQFNEETRLQMYVYK